MAHTALIFDKEGRVGSDLACVGCGYNLRGLSLGGRCPECSIAISRSARGDLLRFSNPEWLDQLASGMTWILGSIPVGLLCVFLSGVLSSSASFLLSQNLIPAFGSFVGCWMLTIPEPAADEKPGQLTLRQLVRILAATSLVSGAKGLVPYLGSGPLATFADFTSVVVWITSYFAELLYLRRLALRIPDPRLAHHTRIIMWGATTLSILFYIGDSAFRSLGAAMPSSAPAAVSIPASPTPSLGNWAAIVSAGCLLGLVAMVLAIWALDLTFRYRRAFKNAAQLARTGWSMA